MSPSATPGTPKELFVSKLCEDKMCEDKVYVSKLCVGKLWVRRREADGRRDTEPKTRTPHKDVGNKGDSRTLNSKPCDILQSSPMRFDVPRLAVKSDIVGTCWHHLLSWEWSLACFCSKDSACTCVQIGENPSTTNTTMCLTWFMGFHTIQLIQWLMWLCQFLCYLVWVSRDITRWYCDQPVVWPEVEHLLGTPSKYAKSKPSTHLNHKWWCHWRFLNDPHVITHNITHNITHVYSILLNTDAFAVCSWMIDWILGLLSELLWQCKLFFVFIVYEWQQLFSPCTQTECCGCLHCRAKSNVASFLFFLSSSHERLSRMFINKHGLVSELWQHGVAH
jgi:hypothetical protein